VGYEEINTADVIAQGNQDGYVKTIECCKDSFRTQLKQLPKLWSKLTTNLTAVTS